MYDSASLPSCPGPLAVPSQCLGNLCISAIEWLFLPTRSQAASSALSFPSLTCPSPWWLTYDLGSIIPATSMQALCWSWNLTSVTSQLHSTFGVDVCTANFPLDTWLYLGTYDPFYCLIFISCVPMEHPSTHPTSHQLWGTVSLGPCGKVGLPSLQILQFIRVK